MPVLTLDLNPRVAWQHARLASLLTLLALAPGCPGLEDASKPDTGETADSAIVDIDGDGSPAAEDCDDAHASVYPGADEACNGLDDDCDGETDEDPAEGPTGYTDADGDGHGDPNAPIIACDLPEDLSLVGDDCDDTDPEVAPDAVERCNDVDDDCDDETDEDPFDGDTWYHDRDGDGFGSPSESAQLCAAEDGYVADATDCDDGDPARHPGAPEACDGEDDDCDGSVEDEERTDADGDGFYGASCADGDDCDDADPAVYPDAPERCDGADQDCDGTTDDEDLACDCTSSAYGDHDYLFCATSVTWEEALGLCDDAGFGLVAITEGDEGEAVYAGIKAERYGVQWWIGANDIDDEGSFVWWDGTPMDHTNWHDGEPNDEYGIEDCATIGAFSDSTWNDVPCEYTYPFVCESF